MMVFEYIVNKYHIFKPIFNSAGQTSGRLSTDAYDWVIPFSFVVYA